MASRALTPSVSLASSLSGVSICRMRCRRGPSGHAKAVRSFADRAAFSFGSMTREKSGGACDDHDCGDQDCRDCGPAIRCHSTNSCPKPSASSERANPHGCVRTTRAVRSRRQSAAQPGARDVEVRSCEPLPRIYSNRAAGKPTNVLSKGPRGSYRPWSVFSASET